MNDDPYVNVSLDRTALNGPTVIKVEPDNERWSVVITLNHDMEVADNDLLTMTCDRLNDIADSVVRKVEAEIAAQS
jgi:hypothetical protein